MPVSLHAFRLVFDVWVARTYFSDFEPQLEMAIRAISEKRILAPLWSRSRGCCSISGLSWIILSLSFRLPPPPETPTFTSLSRWTLPTRAFTRASPETSLDRHGLYYGFSFTFIANFATKSPEFLLQNDANEAQCITEIWPTNKTMIYHTSKHFYIKGSN